MGNLNNINYELIYSSSLLEGTNSLNDFHNWFAEKKELGKFEVELAPLNTLKDWSMDNYSGAFEHNSGKFFTVNGLKVEHEVNGAFKHWAQLIINQSEQGILGFLAKRIDGTIHVLVQAKMEPGNINFIQISPTVQSTRSNFTKVHGGKSTKFIEYFLGKPNGTVIFNQLRSEQGSRYYRKRNQNIVILLEDNHNISEDKNFFWLTLGQLRELHKIPNLVHLDCRSIIGGMPFSIPLENDDPIEISFGNKDIITSLHCNDSDSLNSLRQLMSWFTQEKMKNIKHTKLVSIHEAKHWSYDGNAIKHEDGKFFDIIGVNVHSPGREVTSWSQPLIQCVHGGIIGLIAQVHNGVLHFLINARFEAGFIDTVELAATVQFAPRNYKVNSSNQMPHFIKYFENDSKNEIIVDTFLSNEGGRFFRSENRHIIVKVSNSEKIVVPENFAWMTLSQIHSFGSMELSLNVELRSLIFCLPFSSNK
jgi:dTDP-4-dehydro-6-deoxy-alpha-D-glucopyranose 2,3-dehydratase